MYEMLVDLLVATALVDKSAPPCWRTNELLGAIERLVAVTRGQYGEFAEIASAALKELSIHQCDPAVRVLLKLAVITGRRQCGVEKDDAVVQRLFDDVQTDIANLEEGPRKHRCLTFMLYQRTVFLGDRCGLYAEAAKSAKAEASMNTEPDKKAISMYIARVYAMYAAIVSGVRDNKIRKAFDDLVCELPLLYNGVICTALAVQWGCGNGPIDLLRSMILCNNHDHVKWGANMAIVLANRADLGKAFEPAIRVLVAENTLRQGNILDAIFEAEKVADNASSPPMDRALAYLIMARAQSNMSSKRAVKNYAQITAGSGTHVVAAVAARELAQLQK